MGAASEQLFQNNLNLHSHTKPKHFTLKKAIDYELEIPLGVKTVLILTHVKDCENVYFQWERINVTFDNDKLKKCGQNARQLSSAKQHPGEYCIVHHEGDILNRDGYYRGEIISNNSKEHCNVQLIDLGVVVTKHSRDILELPPEFFHQRRLAVQIGLRDVVRLWERDVHSSLAKSLLENKLGIERIATVLVSHYSVDYTILDRAARCWGDIFSTCSGENIIQYLLDSCSTKRRSPRADVYHLPFNNKEQFMDVLNIPEKQQSLLVGNTYPIRITHLTGLDDLYLIKQHDETLYCQISKTCARMASMGCKPYAPWIANDQRYGQLCMVWLPETKKFYRGKVLLIDQKHVIVNLIDIGKEYQCLLTDLSELEPSLRTDGPLAYHCQLPLSLTEEVSVNLIKRLHRLNDIHGIENGLTARILSVNDKNQYTIDLKLVREGITFSEALMDVHEACIRGPKDILLQIQGQLERWKLQSSLAEKHAVPPMTWHTRAERQGFDVTSSSQGIKDLITLIEKSEEISISELSEFHYSRLNKPPPIKDLEGKLCLFNRLIGFNICTIIDKTSGSELTTQLENSISDWIKTGNGLFLENETPKVGDIVLAKQSNAYRRAVVESIKEKSSGNFVVTVHCLEFGTSMEFPIKDLRKPNGLIMEIPLFVYFVQLKGVMDDTPALITHFREMRNRLNATAIVDSIETDQKSGIVSVVLLHEKNKRPLNAMIRTLAIWQWRRLYRGLYISFPEHLKKMGHPMTKEEYYKKVTITEAMKRAKLEIRVRKVYYSSTDIFIAGIPVDSTITYQNRSLFYQLMMFTEKISDKALEGDEVKTYPHMLAVKINDKRLQDDTYPTLCTWHRTFYNDETEQLSCIDCFWKTSHEIGKFADIDIRRLTPDFYQACPMGITCKIHVGENLDEKKIKGMAKKLFPKGRLVTVILTSKEPTVLAHTLYYSAKVSMQ